MLSVTHFTVITRRQPPQAHRRSRGIGAVDVAAVWGPVGRLLRPAIPVSLTLAPIGDTDDFRPLAFTFDIAMGVRKGDHALRMAIDEVSRPPQGGNQPTSCGLCASLSLPATAKILRPE